MLADLSCSTSLVATHALPACWLSAFPRKLAAQRTKRHQDRDRGPSVATHQLSLDSSPQEYRRSSSAGSKYEHCPRNPSPAWRPSQIAPTGCGARNRRVRFLKARILHGRMTRFAKGLSHLLRVL